MVTGIIVGYDPGGNGCHGVAELRIRAGVPTSLETWTEACAEDVMQRVEQARPLIALGVDTLTCWSSGKSGWRPADRWLKDRYPDVQRSVVTPNGLYGSMALNGMAVLIEARRVRPDLLITETHPKVLYSCFSNGLEYNYENNRTAMDDLITAHLGLRIETGSEHEWDAALSAFAALKGVCGHWVHDLHALQAFVDERLVWPCGKTHYYWPE